MKQHWLNIILHLSSIIYKKKRLLFSVGIFKTIVISLEIIGLELILSIISLPSYLFIAPDEAFTSYYNEIKIFRLRRKLTLLALLVFLFIYFIQSSLTLVGLFSFPHNSQASNPQVFISNGINAIDSLGQYDGVNLTDPQPLYGRGTANNAPNRLGYSFPTGVLIDTVNHRFFVADNFNNRVLIYNLNTNNTFPDSIPDNVLGQPDFTTNTSGTTQSTLNHPGNFAYDSANNRLFVTDNNNNRVMVYDVTSITDGENAVNVLGQPDFTTATAATTQAKMNGLVSLAYDSTNNRLFTVQTSSNRVTVYDVASITDGENAVNVLGQTNFTTGTLATTQAKMSTPYDVAYDGVHNRLFVAQTGGNRVTVYDVASITDGENAVNVLGQTDFTTATSGTTQAKMNSPQGITYDSVNNRLFVANSLNHSVTVYDVASITDGENAINVLGQTDFTTATSGTTQAKLNRPKGLAYDSTNNRLFVADNLNHRVVEYDGTAITNGQNARDAFGQYNGTSVSNPQPDYARGNSNDTPNRLGFNSVSGELIDSVYHRLFVADTTNNRVLIYNLNTDNTFTDRIPDNVLGQPNFVSNTATTTASGMSAPRQLAYDSINNRLFVVQSGNHRVTIYDAAAITDGENAVNVLGQPDFTTATAGNTQAKMSSPQGIAYDSVNNRLFVAQSGNHRVTIYDVAAITDGENAINVLGQPDFTTATAGNTQAKMNNPQGIAYDSVNNRLFVAQSGNHRVTIYDVAAITDGENAVNILGQPNFATAIAGNTESIMNSPQGVVYDSVNNRLFVSQSSNNRVTVYDVASITDGENAVNVLGQPDFATTSTGNTQAKLSGSKGLAYDTTNNRLLVADSGNHRVMVFGVSVAGFNITETSGNTTVIEGGDSDTFDITLTAQPNTDVVFDITSGDPTKVTVTPSTLTFTNTNWNIPQTITVNGLEDMDIDVASETQNITVAVNDAASDDAWDTLDNQIVNVNVIAANNEPSPIIAEVTPVPALTNSNTPAYTFSSTAAGSITYGGDCSSTTVLATIGDNAITFNTLADGIHSNCTITVTGASDSNLLNVSSFDVDATAPTLAEVTPIAAFTNDSTPSYTFSTNEGGTITYGGDCSSSATFAVSGDNSINFNTLADGLHDTCTITVTDDAQNQSTPLPVSSFTIDTVGLTVLELTPISTPTNNNTPTYTFSSTAEGAITYGSDCSSSTTSATSGNNTITLNMLSDGIYSNCTISVTDVANNVSNILEISPFKVNTSIPALTEVTPIATLISDQRPVYTFSTDEEGTISYGGDCTSSTTSAVIGNNMVIFDTLPEGTHNNCTISVTDDANNPSNVLSVSAFSVDISDPVLAEVTAVPVVTGNSTPSYTFSSSEAGTIFYDEDCTSESTSAAIGNNTITFRSLNDGHYGHCTIMVQDATGNQSAPLAVSSFTVDTIAPVLAEITAIPNLSTNKTPRYTFSSTEAGAITYSGGCASSTSTAIMGNNTITFNALHEGIYDCTMIVTDTALNSSTSLVINHFKIIHPSSTDDESNSIGAGGGSGGGGGGSDTSNVIENNEGSGSIESNENNEKNDIPELPKAPKIPKQKVFKSISFTDLDKHWAKTYVNTLSDTCKLKRYPGSDDISLHLFKPDQEITRAEFIELLVDCKNYPLVVKNGKLFNDVSEQASYAIYVSVAQAQGLIVGYADGTFRPNDTITRKEALKIALLAQYTEDKIQGGRIDFSDILPHQWYTKYIMFAYLKGIISGYSSPDNPHIKIFGIDNKLTRAEAAKILVKTLEL